MTETKGFLPPRSLNTQAEFGFSVAIAGTTLVAGAPFLRGAVEIFDTTSGNATGQLILQNAAPGSDFGLQLAITTNANQIVVSAPDQSVAGIQYVGALYVFVKPNHGWKGKVEYTAELSASDPSQPPYAATLGGSPIAVSPSGDEVVAAGSNATHVPAEYLFVRGIGGWTSMTQTDEITELNGNRLLPVALSGDTICAGGYDATVNGNPYQGAAFVFQFR